MFFFIIPNHFKDKKIIIFFIENIFKNYFF
jgi:hypothetical protein